MLNSLLFRVKENVNTDKYRFLELFFKDWVDDTCNREVFFNIENQDVGNPNHVSNDIYQACIFKVVFEKQEDALALKLKGIPKEFQHYLEIVN